MILALATRHRVERPAISMEGGTVISYGAALPAAVCFAFEKHRDKKNPHSTKCGFCRLKQIANASHRETHLLFKKMLKNLTRLDKYEKINIGSVFPMHLENVEYSVIYIGDFAVFPRSAGSADSHEIPGGRSK